MRYMRILIFALFTSFIYAIDTNPQTEILRQISEISRSVGLIMNDTLIQQEISEKQQTKLKYLYRATEYYKNEDYESSLFYIKKVNDFRNIDLNNLKYVIKVGSYAKIKDINNTIRYHFSAFKKIDPENMRIIRKIIADNFSAEIYYDQMDHYFVKPKDLNSEFNKIPFE